MDADEGPSQAEASLAIQTQLDAQEELIKSIDPLFVDSTVRGRITAMWRIVGKAALQSKEFRNRFFLLVETYARSYARAWITPTRKSDRKEFLFQIDKARVAIETVPDFGRIFYLMMGGQQIAEGLSGRMGKVCPEAILDHDEAGILSKILPRLKTPSLLATDMVGAILMAFELNWEQQRQAFQQFVFDLGSKFHKLLVVDCETTKVIRRVLLKALPRIVSSGFFQEVSSSNYVLFQSVLKNLDILIRGAEPLLDMHSPRSEEHT